MDSIVQVCFSLNSLVGYTHSGHVVTHETAWFACLINGKTPRLLNHERDLPLVHMGSTTTPMDSLIPFSSKLSVQNQGIR